MKGMIRMIQQGTEIKKEKITNTILMLVLLVYPLRKAAVGLDMMDAGYALGNYRFFDTMNENWKIATYLANVLGVLLSKLPFGNTWVGMNVYTSLLIGIIAVVTYNFLIKEKIINKWIAFLGELAALSLCWAPSVVLYHYLGYILMTAAVLLLYKALTGKNKLYLIMAGVILGAAAAVRMPNITYMALIIPVWYYAWLNRDKEQNKQWFGLLLQQTGYCIAGYAAGVLLPIGYICIRYGMEAYPNMIVSLFGMTDTATDYKPTSMVTAMFEDYIAYSAWLCIFAVYLLAGFIMMRLFKERFERVKKVLYIAGYLVLLRFCYGRGMFDFNYTAYFSMYKWITVFLLVSILLCIWLIISKKAEREHKLWAVFLLVMIFITPLGSNNGLYPIINNMFLAVPLTMGLLWYYVSKGWISKNRTITAFVTKSMTIFICICVAVQSILFGVFFVFHDASKSILDYTKANITGSQSTKGLYTTVDKADELDLLGGYLQENDLLQKEVILYGNIPAISYIYDLKPAVYTTWADLASNSLELLETELASKVVREKEPLVIMSTEAATRMAEESEREADKKLDAIYEYLTEMEYDNTYTSAQFYVYEAP